MKVSVAHLKGKDYAHLNVSAVVGIGGKNLKDDVMLIQGLLNYIARSPFLVWAYMPGLKMPDITGIFDGNTLLAISMFQIINASFLYKPRFDCRIHPASYLNRRINNLNQLMIITRLNYLADAVALSRGKQSFIPDLKKMSPELKQAVHMAPWEIENH